MPGEFDQVYEDARRTLLDALGALERQRDAVVVVGAQAIYLHTDDADFAVAPYTTDGDIALDPGALRDDPNLSDAMRAAGFVPDVEQPGTWIGSGKVRIDLMVPAALAGSGRRGARLGVHGNRAARRARGLEAALIDNTAMTVGALEPTDRRRFSVRVAGPAALLVAKLHKLADRQDDLGRLNDKDAMDVYRILRSVSTSDLAACSNRVLDSALGREVGLVAIEHLASLFAKPAARGCQMAARALAPLQDPEETAAGCAALTTDLLLLVSPD
jgi:hypothetical protein